MSENELPVINKQPPENLYRHVRSHVEVVDIFRTIQGEGPFAGTPSVFIRTAGCNLRCLRCDTSYTTGRTFHAPNAIVAEVQRLQPSGGLVVITGGEPFRQNISPLCKLLINTGYIVQAETNGTYHWDGFPYGKVLIVCSPKTPKLHPRIPVDYYKYIIEDGKVSEEDGLPTSVLGNDIVPARPRKWEIGKIPIYVSPLDVKNETQNQKNVEAAVNSVMKFNYILNIQTQKIIGLP